MYIAADCTNVFTKGSSIRHDHTRANPGTLTF